VAGGGTAAMLMNLLKDRFQLAAHLETREFRSSTW